jgi:RNA polymerase sigma-70 factor (ECF subfamily)
MTYQSDQYYIEKVLNNDISAFSPLVVRHKNMVFTLALRIVKNREDAEEIAQDVFIKAYQSLKSFKNESKFSTWLYKIAFNSAISKTRKKHLETTELKRDFTENYTNEQIIEETSQLDEDEQKILISKVLSQLNEEDNVLITLFYYNDNSVEEISDITGLSTSNVKVKLFRLRKKLYGQITEIMSKEFKKTTHDQQ